MKKNKVAWLLPFIVIIILRSCNAIREQETGETRYQRYQRYKAGTTSSQMYNIDYTECKTMAYYEDKTKDSFYAVMDYACLKEGYPLYDWYKDDMNVKGYCEKDQIVYVESTNGEYAHVFTDKNIDGYIPTSILEYIHKEYLEQDISEPSVKVLKKQKLGNS